MDSPWLSETQCRQAQFIAMASKKHKSSDSRPQDQSDNRRFQSEEAWNRYIDNILDQRILLERNVELYHSKYNEFKIELERQNLHKRLSNLQEGSIDVAVVMEFYANFCSPTDQVPKCVKIRGHLIKIDADSLNEFLQTPVLLEEGESLPTYSRFCRLRSDPREMEARLCITGKGFILNTEGQPWKLLRKDLTTLAQTWSVFSYSNLAPTSRTSDLNTDRARLFYGLITRMDMNIGGLISRQMTMIAQSNSSRLGFPTLIAALCRSKGVGSDALTSYENLRPAIDLVYIIRNCWNANDQIVNFPETKKTKLRAADIPPSFTPIAGIPTSSTSTPAPALADLSSQSSQASDAKFQSLFEGQHELELENDHSSEATISGAVDCKTRRLETRSNEVVHHGPVPALADAPFPGVDPSSPQHAADSSIPILEIHEGQTIPVLPLDTSPPVTPVWHLTDEKNVQILDNQNQSQEF
ncbi:hypothetical protein HKD37_14G040337 [Glycine soja]